MAVPNVLPILSLYIRSIVVAIIEDFFVPMGSVHDRFDGFEICIQTTYQPWVS